MCTFQPSLCQQCTAHSAHFKYDSRAGGYEIACGRCGRLEYHETKYDDDGNYCGFRHESSQGYGVLFFRYTSGHEFYSHSLNTFREVIDAESWLREALRSEMVDPETASLTKWDDEGRRIEVVLGERVDLLAGKIVRMSGVPGEAEHRNRGESQADQRTMR